MQIYTEIIFMIVLYNPQIDDFILEPPHFKFLKRKALKKYSFLITEHLKINDNISILVDWTASAFIPDLFFKFFPFLIRYLIVELEFCYWKKINNL